MFIQRLTNLFDKFSDTTFAVSFGIGAVLFFVLYFFLNNFLFDCGSKRLMFYFSATLILTALIVALCGLSGYYFVAVLSVLIIVIVILHSLELKKIIWSHVKNKQSDIKHGSSNYYDEEKVNNCINEIIKALQNMSKNDIGAIIVLSTDNIPEQILDSGVRVNSEISSALIESIFFPKTPLHDGAMIISDTKIVASGCFLPLTQNTTSIPKDLGTRHRAGIGITENVDVVSIIVSEETGIISIANGGKITRYADTEMLKKTLHKYYWQSLESARK